MNKSVEIEEVLNTKNYVIFDSVIMDGELKDQ